MSKQIFYHGCMNASKSAQLLMQNYNYKEQGLKTMLIKPAIDTRDGLETISSRIGLNGNADYLITPKTTQEDIVKFVMSKNPDIILFLDEAQFLNSEQIDALSETTRMLDIEFHCFGLLKDFKNYLFEGSKSLLETSDNIVEIKTTCSKCTRKATCNLRLNDGNPVYDGDIVKIGGNESYVSVCRKHYYNHN